MRQIDEDALHELNIKMRSFLDNVAKINHVHEDDKVIKMKLFFQFWQKYKKCMYHAEIVHYAQQLANTFLFNIGCY